MQRNGASASPEHAALLTHDKSVASLHCLVCATSALVKLRTEIRLMAWGRGRHCGLLKALEAEALSWNARHVSIRGVRGSQTGTRELEVSGLLSEGKKGSVVFQISISEGRQKDGVLTRICFTHGGSRSRTSGWQWQREERLSNCFWVGSARRTRQAGASAQNWISATRRAFFLASVQQIGKLLRPRIPAAARRAPGSSNPYP